MEDNWPSDSTIENYLNEKTDLPNQKWSQRRIKGLKEIENPILDSEAVKIAKENDKLKQNPTISILSSKGSAFDIEKVDEIPDPYTPIKQTRFRSQLGDGSYLNKPINPRIEALAVGAQFLNQPDAYQNLDINSLIQSSTDSLKYRWEYLLVDVDDLSTPGNNTFEPIVCSLFVIDNKKIVSERWQFFPPCSMTFFECKLHSQQAAIDVSELSENSYLIATYYRIFQVDSGDLCNSYYKKPSESQLQKAIAQVNLSCQRLKGCYTPFAFSFIPLKSIISNQGGNIEFPNAYIPEKPLTGEYIPEMIERVKKLNTLPIVLKLKSKIQKVSNLKNVDSNYIQIRSIQDDVPQPIFEYRHQLIVTLGAAKFDLAGKLNARNILAEVLFTDNDKKLPVIHNKWAGPGLVESVYSRCLYHERSPIYDDEFIIDLPNNLSPSASIKINYYHIATQEKEQAMRYFASAVLPINEKGLLIKDGVNTISISYANVPPSKATPSNCQLIKTQLYSTINSPDDMLSPMFGGTKKVPAIEFAKESKVANYLFQILDSLIEGLTTNQPKASAKGLIFIGNLSKTIGADKLSDLLNFYVNTFALRTKETQTTIIHKELMKFWIDYLNGKEGSVPKNRKDIPVSSFLFMLILKSIIVTNDRNFNESFTPFLNKLKGMASSLAQTQNDLALVFNRSLANFVACLTDIGFYELSERIVLEYSNSFGNTENDFIALTDFLSAAIHPKLFVAASLAQNTFPALFESRIKLALQTPNNSKIQSIYQILARLFLFVPEKDRPEVASKYVCLLKLFSQYPIKLEKQTLRFLLSDIVFIFKYVKQFEFLEFYNVSNTKKTKNEEVEAERQKVHQQFNSLVHFVLTKSRIPYVRPKSQIPQVQLDMLKESLRQMDRKSGQTIIQTSDSVVPMTSPSVHDALTNIARETDNQDYELQSVTYPEVRDLAVDAQLSVFNILNHIIDDINNNNATNTDSPAMALDILYHYLTSNISIDLVRQIKECMIKFIEKNTGFLIQSTNPPFVLFLTKLFSLLAMKNTAASNELVNILTYLFTAEKRIYPTNNRSLVSSIRAVSKLKDEDLESPSLLKSLESCSDNGGVIDKTIECIKSNIALNEDMRLIDDKHFSELRYKQIVGRATSNETNIEKYGEDMFARSKSFSISPDACAEEIGRLTQYHDKNDYLSESLMAQIYQVALIVEYLTVFKFIENPYAKAGVEHPAMIFYNMCNSVVDHKCPDYILEDPPKIPGFCDSSMFSMSGIYMLIQAIHSYCQRSKLFEISNEVMRLTYPIFEQCNLYKQLSDQFSIKANMSYQFIENMSSGMDRMLGRYYRIGFYGKIFGSDDGKMFIQREVKLTHLFDVTNRIKNTYIKLFGADKIEIITESGIVDRALLNPEKGFIQLTFVEPYFEKKELPKRVTVFECSNKLGMFKFETPFVKGEKKLQGNVETQWQRRTILKVKTTMPSVLKRVEVPPEGYIVREYEPIRVSIRQIKERLVLYETAIAKNDAQAIQPLLHGSLLVQVNEGPTKMAEVFLGSPLRTKYTEKMRKLFQKFLDLNAKALAIHASYVAKNPGFQELQHQLEEGLTNLTAKLAPYIYSTNQK